MKGMVNVIKSWEEMKIKYPECRDDMTEEREKDFVEDCYDLYEREGFARKFWSVFENVSEYQGKLFSVVGRTKSADLECLPMWQIRFSNGEEISAYPDEIIPSEMKAQGCNIEEYC